MAKKPKERTLLQNKYLNTMEFHWDPSWGDGTWRLFPTERSSSLLREALIQSDSKWSQPWLVQHACNEWKFKIAGLFPAPYNVFRPYPCWDAYERAMHLSRDPNGLYFLRFWLDRMVEITSYSIWSHVYRVERELNRDNKKRDTLAEEHAEQVFREFEASFV